VFPRVGIEPELERNDSPLNETLFSPTRY